MLLGVGKRIKFRHTGDFGIVTAMLGNGMVMIRLEGEDMEIPAFEDDLVDPQDNLQPVPVRENERKSAVFKTISKTLDGKGIQLGFLPVYGPEEQIESYELFLLNGSRNPILFTFTLSLIHQDFPEQRGELPISAMVSIGTLLYDQLNDAPIAQCSCWPVTISGTGSRRFKEIKIRARNLFKAHLVGQMIVLTVFDSMEPVRQPEEDLRSYTERFRGSGLAKSSHKHEIRERASFVPEIDLHLDKLLPDHHKLNNADKLRIQIRHFEAFLEKAIRLGVPRVYIIHGVGKGRLRNVIADRLIKHPDVITFRNEYHHKYGFGATEVILQE